MARFFMPRSSSRPHVGTVSLKAVLSACWAWPVRAGDPRLHAFSLMGPMLMGLLWRETLQPVGGDPIDLGQLAQQHCETVLSGLLQ